MSAMDHNENLIGKAETLRKRAEKIIDESRGLLPENQDDLPYVLHELRVHQIELEMQNDELLRIQLALEESRARYFDLYNLAPVGYCTLNEKGLVLEANLTAASMLGVTRSAMTSQHLSQFVFNLDQDTYYQHRRRLTEIGRPLECELRLVRQDDGSNFWVRIHSSIAQESGSPLHLTILTDISARKQAEADLRESQAKLEQRVAERTFELNMSNLELIKAARIKDEFLASMSHELRTPLSSMLGLTEVLKLKAYGQLNDRQMQALDKIEINGQQLLDLINTVLDYACIISGKFDLRIEPCLLMDVCQTSLAEFDRQIRAKQQNVSFKIDPLPMLIQADEQRVKQMLAILLSNAVKFTSAGGSLGIDVTANETNQLAHITVWDTGVGIRAQDLPFLFQAFTPLDSSLVRQYSGTGLGLALVKRLVELQGGSIRVESTFGVGSRFTLDLPMFEPGDL